MLHHEGLGPDQDPNEDQSTIYPLGDDEKDILEELVDLLHRELKQREDPKFDRVMWLIAQEYDGKINSGDLISISEVVRDLYRAENQPEQSYSERQLYEAALDRMAREIAAVNKMSETEAVRLIVFPRFSGEMQRCNSRNGKDSRGGSWEPGKMRK